MKLKAAVYSIMKGGEDSAVASVRLARYVAQQLKLPLHMGSSLAEEGRLDLLIIINGPMLYAMTGSSAPIFSRYALRTPHLVWVQNDYTIYAPADKDHSKATVGFRHDFARRREPLHYWTTCEKQVNRTEGSSYVNWNSLTYEPRGLPTEREVLCPRQALYYGAYRHARIPYFDRYFRGLTRKELMISSVSKHFKERYPHAEIMANMPRAAFHSTLQHYGCGLYLEDRRSHKEFHSPANRFYEMLSVGLPILFQPEAQHMMERAGYDVSSYAVEDAVGLRKELSKPQLLRAMGRKQAKDWRRDYRRELDAQVQRAWKRTLKEIA